MKRGNARDRARFSHPLTARWVTQPFRVLSTMVNTDHTQGVGPCPTPNKSHVSQQNFQAYVTKSMETDTQ